MSDVSAVVISLPDATERRAAITERFAACPFPWRFFDAYRSDGAEEPPYIEDRARTVSGRALTPAERGCALSHYHAIKQHAQAPTSPWLLVFEDDVVVDFSFPFDEVARLLSRAQFDYLRLFIRRPRAFSLLGDYHHFQLIRVRRPAYGTQAYMISQNGARKLLENIQCLEQPIDWSLDQYWVTDVPLVTVHPSPLYEEFSPSSINKTLDRPMKPNERLTFAFRRLRLRLGRELYELGAGRRDRALRAQWSAAKADLNR